jgi:hypothetical protein
MESKISCGVAGFDRPSGFGHAGFCGLFQAAYHIEETVI